MKSEIFPHVPFDLATLERGLNARLPPDLLDLYRLTGGMDLFKDVRRGMYGIEVASPESVVGLTAEAAASVHWDMIQGDVMFARLYGEGEYLLIRCDPSRDDFGRIIYLSPIDPREYWVKIADSLSDFLERIVESRGHPYWGGYGDPGPRLA